VSVSVVFWIALCIGLIAAFFVLLPTVRKGISEQNWTTRGQPPPRETVSPEQNLDPGQNTPPEAPVTTTPPERPPVETPTERPPTTPERPPEPPTTQTTTGQGNQTTTTQPTNQPAETRDRSIYFMQATSSGSDLTPIKVNRKLAVSDSPLLDSLNALLAGPTTAEKNRGLINCIPSGSKVIRVQVIEKTAYINFNEDFQYNTLGREGFTAQIKQIVWTATEFSTVDDVQILIEGNRVDFIGEGIMIGSPLRR
jgi:spore germination protein GerM